MTTTVDPFDGQLHLIRSRVEDTFGVTAEELLACGSQQFGADMVAEGYGELVTYAEEVTATYGRLQRLVNRGRPNNPEDAKRITKVSTDLTSRIERRNYRLNVLHIYLNAARKAARTPTEPAPSPHPPAAERAPRRTR